MAAAESSLLFCGAAVRAQEDHRHNRSDAVTVRPYPHHLVVTLTLTLTSLTSAAPSAAPSLDLRRTHPRVSNLKPPNAMPHAPPLPLWATT